MKLRLLLPLLLLCAIPARGQTVQCQTSNGGWGPCPLNASVQLFTTVAATGTATATAQKVYNFSMSGNIIATWASITGSPATCTFQVKSGDSLGNLINNGSSISVTPSNGTTSTVFTPATTQQTADQITVVYACGTYPSAGTLSLEFVPSTVSMPLDSSGNLKVNVNAFSFSGDVNTNLATLNGTTLGSPSAYGTSPGAVNVIGVNADVTNTVSVIGTLSNNGAAATSNFLAALLGVVQTDPSNGSAATQGRNIAPNVDTAGNLWVSAIPGLRPASYEASTNFAASSTTDNACIYGNSTDTVLLYEVDVSGVQTTAGIVNVQLIRRSAAETGGTSANMTAVRGDVTNYAAASTTPVTYTGTGPTVGTPVGNVDNKYTGFLATSTATPDDLYLWNGRQKPQILIGTSQGVCVNLGGALTGGNLSLTWRWYEIKNISE